MKKTALIALVALACATPAGAQTSEPTKAFFGVNVGMQAPSRTLDTVITVAQPIYGQTAQIAERQEVGVGPIFDISAGYRVWNQLGVAVGFSYFSKTDKVAATASIPSPLLFNSFASVDVGGQNAKRTDKNVYLLAVYFLPVTEKFELAFSAGPSGTRVRQELVNGLTVPPGTQTGTGIVGFESARGWGVNAGVDATYLVTKNYGGGIFVRYNGGQVDLTSIKDVKFGGFQAGIGARIRF